MQRRRTPRPRRRLAATVATAALLLPGAAVLAVAGTAAPAGAAPFTVSNNNPSGAGSLAQAFADASLSTDPSNTITVNPGVGPINLTGILLYDPANNSSLSIEGNGVTIHQTAASGVIHSVSTGSLTIDGVTLSGGNSTSGGGAIASVGTLNLSSCTVTGNTDTGATADILRVGVSPFTGTITITNCTVSANTLIAAATENGIVDSGTTTVTGSTLANNVMTTTGTGDSGDVFDTLNTTLTSSTVTNNTDTSQAGPATGTFNTNALTLTGTTVADNVNSSSAGGAAEGIVASGPFTATGSAITANTNSTNANSADGVINASTAGLTDSSVTGNTNAAGTGTATGGINVGGAALTNSTVSDNTASGTRGSSGAGIADGAASVRAAGSAGKHQPGVGAQATAGSVVLVYATVTGNQAQTGANIASANPLTAFGSVVAKPVGGVDCVLTGAATTSHGWNFSDDSTCGFTNTANGDRQSAGDPLLGPPANNGGPAPTQLPLTGSPLIDALPLASCQADGAAGITTDERGVTRPQGAGCDIGAVEVAVTITAAFTG